MFGHEFGANTAAVVCQVDKRIKAALLHEPLVAHLPIALKTGLASVPSLWIQSESAITKLASSSKEIKDDTATTGLDFSQGVQLKSNSICLTLRQAGLYNFCDLPLFMALICKKTGWTGSIDAKRGLSLIRSLNAAFLSGVYECQRGGVDSELVDRLPGIDLKKTPELLHHQLS